MAGTVDGRAADAAEHGRKNVADRPDRLFHAVRHVLVIRLLHHATAAAGEHVAHQCLARIDGVGRRESGIRTSRQTPAQRTAGAEAQASAEHPILRGDVFGSDGQGFTFAHRLKAAHAGQQAGYAVDALLFLGVEPVGRTRQVHRHTVVDAEIVVAGHPASALRELVEPPQVGIGDHRRRVLRSAEQVRRRLGQFLELVVRADVFVLHAPDVEAQAVQVDRRLFRRLRRDGAHVGRIGLEELAEVGTNGVRDHRRPLLHQRALTRVGAKPGLIERAAHALLHRHRLTRYGPRDRRLLDRRVHLPRHRRRLLDRLVEFPRHGHQRCPFTRGTPVGSMYFAPGGSAL